MKYFISSNQKQALELGITNINQALIFDLLTGLSTWATPEIIDGEVFYWASRTKIAEELPILSLKPDTIYRHLVSLKELGLIDYEKAGKKDCIRLTQKGKSYYVGNESELSQNSEMNPIKLGNESENNSEMNPTYKNTNNINTAKDNNGDKSPERTWTDDDEKLAEQILELVKLSAPSAKMGKNWPDDIRKLRAIDNHTHHEIALLFQFANKHTFWKSNILSPATLRKQWVRLEAEYARYKDKPMPGETPKEARERMRANGLQVVKPKYLNDVGF